MTIKDLLFSNVPNGSPQPNLPAGFVLVAGSSPAQITGGEFGLHTAGNDTAWGFDVSPLTGDIIEVSVRLGAGSGSRGFVLYNSDNDGLCVVYSGTQIRLFNYIDGLLTGNAIQTISNNQVSNQVMRCVCERAGANAGRFTFYEDNVGVGSFSSALYLGHTLKGAAYSRNAADRLKSISFTFTPLFEIDSLTSPLIAGGAFNGTCPATSNFVDGAATLIVGSISSPVVITGGGRAFSGVLTGFVDGVAYPILPLADQTVRLVQGANTSYPVTRTISLPANTVAETFGTDLLINNDKSLAYHFNAANNPLVLNDRGYVNSALTLYKNSLVKSNQSPHQSTFWVRRVTDGKMYSHVLAINASGDVVVRGVFAKKLIAEVIAAKKIGVNTF